MPTRHTTFACFLTAVAALGFTSSTHADSPPAPAAAEHGMEDAKTPADPVMTDFINRRRALESEVNALTQRLGAYHRDTVAKKLELDQLNNTISKYSESRRTNVNAQAFQVAPMQGGQPMTIQVTAEPLTPGNPNQPRIVVIRRIEGTPGQPITVASGGAITVTPAGPNNFVPGQPMPVNTGTFQIVAPPANLQPIPGNFNVQAAPFGAVAAQPRDVLFIRGEMKMEKATFLGVGTSPATPVLQQQLRLTKGMGLVVEIIDPDGPAKTAGLQQNDILTKLNDQLLVNDPQLNVLVRSMKPGDKIKLTIIREAKEQTLTATLTEKEQPSMPEMGQGMHFFTAPAPPPGNFQFTPGIRVNSTTVPSGMTTPTPNSNQTSFFEQRLEVVPRQIEVSHEEIRVSERELSPEELKAVMAAIEEADRRAKLMGTENEGSSEHKP